MVSLCEIREWCQCSCCCRACQREMRKGSGKKNRKKRWKTTKQKEEEEGEVDDDGDNNNEQKYDRRMIEIFQLSLKERKERRARKERRYSHHHASEARRSNVALDRPLSPSPFPSLSFISEKKRKKIFLFCLALSLSRSFFCPLTVVVVVACLLLCRMVIITSVFPSNRSSSRFSIGTNSSSSATRSSQLLNWTFVNYTMRRRERALTAELRFNTNADEKLSGMSPIFSHRMVNLSPLLQMRSHNYFVRPWTLFSCVCVCPLFLLIAAESFLLV